MEWSKRKELVRASLIISIMMLGVWAEKCPNVAFVVHSHDSNDNVTSFMAETFLRDTKLIIVTGHDSRDATVGHRRRKLRVRKVSYNGNPGGMGMTFRTGGRGYLGTHRTMAGILMAMDTIPDIDWVYVLDDDNVVNVGMVCKMLNRRNSSIPLLLGHVGPKHGHAPCRETSSPTKWTCCTDTTKPCLANISSPYRSAFYVYNQEADSMVAKDCRGRKNDCCEVVPWPEGISHGYPYRLERKEDKGTAISFTSNGVYLWPYGGATYALSKAMFEAIGRDTWEQYMYRLQCFNADINVMNTVLNAGYSIHAVDKEINDVATHHAHTIKSQFGAFQGTKQPQEVFKAACGIENLRKIVDAKLFDKKCSVFLKDK